MLAALVHKSRAVWVSLREVWDDGEAGERQQRDYGHLDLADERMTQHSAIGMRRPARPCHVGVIDAATDVGRHRGSLRRRRGGHSRAAGVSPASPSSRPHATTPDRARLVTSAASMQFAGPARITSADRTHDDAFCRSRRHDTRTFTCS